MSTATLQRYAPLAGFLAVGLAIASFAVLGDTPDSNDPTQQVVAFWQDNEDAAGISAGLLALTSLFLVWFAASLRTTLRRAGEDAERLASIAFTGLVFMAISFGCFAGFTAAISDVIDDNLPGEVIQTLSVLNEDFFPLLGVGLVIAMFGSGIAILRHAAFPRWLGYAAIVIGIAFIPAWFIGFPAFGIWILVTSVLMYREGATAPSDTTAARMPA